MRATIIPNTLPTSRATPQICQVGIFHSVIPSISYVQTAAAGTIFLMGGDCASAQHDLDMKRLQNMRGGGSTDIARSI